MKVKIVEKEIKEPSFLSFLNEENEQKLEIKEEAK